MINNSIELQTMLTSDFLLSNGFSDPVRYFDKNMNQFRIEYSIEGYDGTILISPVPQTIPNHINQDGSLYWMQADEQVDDFSDIEILKKHHIGEWNVFINNRKNHLATFNYKQQLIDFMKICDVPLPKTFTTLKHKQFSKPNQ